VADSTPPWAGAALGTRPLQLLLESAAGPQRGPHRPDSLRVALLFLLALFFLATGRSCAASPPHRTDVCRRAMTGGLIQVKNGTILTEAAPVCHLPPNHDWPLPSPRQRHCPGLLPWTADKRFFAAVGRTLEPQSVILGWPIRNQNLRCSTNGPVLHPADYDQERLPKRPAPERPARAFFKPEPQVFLRRKKHFRLAREFRLCVPGRARRT